MLAPRIVLPVLFALLAAGCARQGYSLDQASGKSVAQQPSYTQRGDVRQSYGSHSYAYAPINPPYTLDSGDKLRVVVFGQEGISGSYMVGPGGEISLPLIGAVPARGVTTRHLAAKIAARLKQGFVRDPYVTVDIEAYRPFFILGEVTTPGQYPYVPNMTAENAVAIAGGFSPRAYKNDVQLTRITGGQPVKSDVPLSYSLRPGDTVVVKERWF
jgi:polysaccharide export outer membrane protein